MPGTKTSRAVIALLALLAVTLVAPLAHADAPPLVVAAKAGDAAAVTTLLAQGGDANTADDEHLTALNWAAYDGHIEAVRILVQHGATVDSHASKSGWTPLMNAAAMGFPDIVAYLLAHGANINAHSADGGYTPLMYAARKSTLDVVKLLIDGGADINDTSDDRRTALMFADDHGDAAIVALIAAHGGVRIGN